MNIDFPFHFDSRGRTAATDDDDHIRDMIEEFLFTNSGERVNRPGLRQRACCSWSLRRTAPSWPQLCSSRFKRLCNAGSAM